VTTTHDQQVLSAQDRQLERHVASIADEFRRGFEAVEKIPKPAVAIFGSARLREDDPAYPAARATGRAFAEAGWSVVTGGGPGIMEAANRGAKEGGGFSVGFNIELPHEQRLNPYVDLGVAFNHFYARKTMLVKAVEGFVLFPGGFGTLDEMFESLTLIQTGKVFHFPVVLVGIEYWEGLLDWVHERLLPRGTIATADEELMALTDDPDDAVRVVLECYELACAQPQREAVEAAAEAASN
jgi:uncharacterized protein (TIGR00730 family)